MQVLIIQLLLLLTLSLQIKLLPHLGPSWEFLQVGPQSGIISDLITTHQPTARSKLDIKPNLSNLTNLANLT